MKSILDKKIDLKDLKACLAGPFTAIYDTFLNLFNLRKEITKEDIGTNIVYDVRRGDPIQIRSTRNMSNMEMMYGTDFSTSGSGNASTSGNFALDMYKAGIAREICEQIMKGDLIDWATEDTQNGTQITGRIIVNKF